MAHGHGDDSRIADVALPRSAWLGTFCGSDLQFRFYNFQSGLTARAALAATIRRQKHREAPVRRAFRRRGISVVLACNSVLQVDIHQDRGGVLDIGMNQIGNAYNVQRGGQSIKMLSDLCIWKGKHQVFCLLQCCLGHRPKGLFPHHIFWSIHRD